MYQFLSFTHESTYFKILKEYKALNYSYKRLPQIIIFFRKKNRQKTDFIDTWKEKNSIKIVRTADERPTSIRVRRTMIEASIRSAPFTKLPTLSLCCARG